MNESPELPSTQTRTSLSLIERVRESDPKGWNRLVQLYAPMIYSWCRQLGLQPSDAEDIGQDVFGAVATSIGSFVHAGKPGAFRSWLWTITRNKIRDAYRKDNRRPTAIGGTDFQAKVNQVPDLTVEPPSDVVYERGLVQRALDQLRDDFEESSLQCFYRMVVDGESASEIGRSLGMTSQGVRQAKYRVVQRLRTEFGEILDIPMGSD